MSLLFKNKHMYVSNRLQSPYRSQHYLLLRRVCFVSEIVLDLPVDQYRSDSFLLTLVAYSKSYQLLVRYVHVDWMKLSGTSSSDL